MYKLLEKLRQKSEGYRRGITIGTSLVVTLAIFGIWVSVIFPGTISESQTLASKNKNQNGPLSTFKRNVAQTYEAIRGEWSIFGNKLKQTQYEAGEGLQIMEPDKNAYPLTPENLFNSTTTSTTQKTNNPASNNAGTVIY